MEHIKTLETILDNKIDHSLRVIRLAAEMSEQYYDAPLIITYSGGKDSDVLVDLAVRSGASVEFEHSLTTVDAPETVNHVKEVFKRLEDKGYKTTIHRPDISMWRLIEKKLMPPTRIVRYCCRELKESTTPNRYVATGVRGGVNRDNAGLEWNLRPSALLNRRAEDILWNTLKRSMKKHRATYPIRGIASSLLSQRNTKTLFATRYSPGRIRKYGSISVSEV